MNELRSKINQRMDELECMMNRNVHMADPNMVMRHMESITKFWSILSDEDRDYIHCARDALEEGRVWKVENEK